ncbi:hypothetical protein C1I98_33325 [Spongiactinospora gelatinilytica]|uniref:Uncharacterized protein n=1 Tax=Spongiactinospora gelatinilytica TaxID=2666298 RepID=A0A2W2G032_9ACTN|nr:hypothetical protein [Spongiactinospora gelatinilytica]PZG27477.1 hypothetical protein C1I98_33325 [Spongiactinospora gelatinilytica]
MFRQGDILLMPVAAEAVPERLVAAPRDERGRLVPALGEATGHAHAVPGAGTLLVRRGSDMPEFLHLPEGGRLVYEEHAAISLPKGWFRVVRQREYVPGSYARYVAD